MNNKLYEDIVEKICNVSREQNVLKAILFGSFARQTFTKKSDIDIIFIQETKKRFLNRLDAFLLDLYKYISGYAIEVFVYTPEEFSKMKESGNHFIKRAVDEELDSLPTLYKFDIVDFFRVSEKFRTSALKYAEYIR